jgi:multimeric flavodoxin WrbA
MNIVILNGNPDGGPEGGAPAFDRYLEDLGQNLEGRGHTVQIMTLRDLAARYCTGCWGCWVKTPGQCIFEDDSHTVSRAVINSDFLLFASPVMMGYLSALMKKYMDKLIQLIHPYITVVQAEAHHKPRYDREDYPVGALLLEKTPGTDDEDIDIITAIHERTMLNFQSRHAFTMLTSQPVEEVAHAIHGL